MAITLSGAIGSSSYTLDFDNAGQAYDAAKLLNSFIDSQYSSAVIYAPNEHYIHSGVLLVGDAVADNRINAAGFGAVIDENNDSRSTVFGGGDQTVIGGDGGMNYRTSYGNVVIDLGGGSNNINLLQDAGSAIVYIGGSGANTVVAGSGNTTIAAGSGTNIERLGAGNDVVSVSGHDHVFLGSGAATIDVLAGGSALVSGNSAAGGSGYSLVFVNANEASTVQGGGGSYSIFGGAGGGLYIGGKGGHNSILGGSGNVTLRGGGAGDTLMGGSGTNLIWAASGNETLGGAGKTTFVFNSNVEHNTAGVVDTITDWHANDLLQLSGGAAAVNYALSTYQVSGGSGSFYLQDGTKIVLEGYTGALTKLDFKH